MIFTVIDEPVFQAQVWFYLGCDGASCEKHVSKKINQEIDLGFEKGNDGAVNSIANDSGNIFIIWIKNPLCATVLHEAHHLSWLILTTRGVAPTDASMEAFAYYHEFWDTKLKSIVRKHFTVKC